MYILYVCVSYNLLLERKNWEKKVHFLRRYMTLRDDSRCADNNDSDIPLYLLQINEKFQSYYF